MHTKFILIGLMLIIIGLVIGYIGYSAHAYSVLKGTHMFNGVLGSGNATYVPISISKNTTIAGIVMAANSEVNMYLFNESTFDLWSNYTSQNNRSISSLVYAKHVGGNSSVVKANVSNLAITLFSGNRMLSSTVMNDTSSTWIKYFAEISTFPCTVYAVIDNSASSKSHNDTVHVQVVVIPADQRGLLATYMATGIMLLAGVATVVYGLVNKPRNAKAEKNTSGGQDSTIATVEK